MNLYSAEIRTLRTADQKYLERFEIWCWRRMEISWTDHVRSEEVLHSRVKEERNLLHTVKGRKANWIGQILRRNCLLFLCLFVCFPGVTTHCVCIFHSPVEGLSLLFFEFS
jgi:hypothetical protein